MYIPLSNIPQTIFHRPKKMCLHYPSLLTYYPQHNKETNYLMDINTDDTPNLLLPTPPDPLSLQMWERAMGILPGALLLQTEVVWDQAAEGKQQKTSV